MKVRAGFLLSSTVTALLLGAGPMISTSHAADTAMPTKAMPAAEPDGSAWTSEGYVEAGGRFFVEKNGGAMPHGGQNLGKFYEYRDLRPGAFGNLGIMAASKDGLYGIDVWAENIGYNDQRYIVDLSKAGEYYLSLGWDQTPHTYRTNASTIFSGVGSTTLTAPNMSGLLTTPNTTAANTSAATAPNANSPALGAGSYQSVQTFLNNNSHSIDLGIRRDTASAAFRWTPSTDWDVKVDYSRMRREGTQPQAAVTFFNTALLGTANWQNGASLSQNRVVLELPKPVDDTTHNVNASGEYAGTTPWGKKFNVTVAYGASIYRDDFDAFTFVNPWSNGTTSMAGANNTYGTPYINQMSTPPSNTAQNIRVSGGVDLPWNSRYTGTVQYTLMQQDSAFLPFSMNPNLPWTLTTGAANFCGSTRAGATPSSQCAAYVPSTAPVISAASLGGNVTNILVNNALTTRITSDLTSTFKYRYFSVNDYSNTVSVDKWLTADTNYPSADGRTRPSSAYTKENGSADLVWRAQRWLTMGVGYGLEVWDRDNRDVAVTTENIGKAFLDLKPWDQAQFRSRFQYSQRRFDQYIPTIESNDVNMREYDLANRDRTQGKFSLDFFPINNVTVTPTGGFRFDHYGTDPYTAHEIGLINDRMSNAGVEVAFNVIPGVKFMTSYMYEDAYRNLVQNAGQYALEVRDKINTLMLAGEFKIIPDKLIVNAAFTHSWSTSANIMSPGPSYTAAGSYAPLATVPDVTTRYSQVDVTGKYLFDAGVARQLGVKQVYAKVRYLWERNDVADWQAIGSDYFALMQAVGNATSPLSTVSATNVRSLFMGDNPNYDVQLIALSLGASW